MLVVPSGARKSKPCWFTTATPWPLHRSLAKWFKVLCVKICSPWSWNIFKQDTADYADYVLPATTQLEH
jgi:hypothetical protein